MKRKFVLKNKRRFVMSCLFFLLAGILYISSVSAAAENISRENRYVMVMPGDTLWDIAEEHAGSTDLRKYIFHLRELNQLENATIYAGQKIYLP